MSQKLQKNAASLAPEIKRTTGTDFVKVEHDKMPSEMVVRQDGYDGEFKRCFSYMSGDLSLSVGTWESEAGTLICENYPWEEYCLVLEGIVAIRNASGTVDEFHPGDSFVLPKGWVGTWEMKTRFRKQFVVADFGLEQQARTDG